MRLAKQDTEVLRILKEQIRTGILGSDDGTGNIEALQQRIILIDIEIDAKISSVTADNIEDYDDNAIMELLTEKANWSIGSKRQSSKTQQERAKKKKCRKSCRSQTC